MKYLVLLVVLLLVIGIARSIRRRGADDQPAAGERKPTAPRVPGPQPMVACAQCGMHLPEHEAVAGRGGLFCGEPHRLQFERAHPDA